MYQPVERRPNYALKFLRKIADQKGQVVIDSKNYQPESPTDSVRWAVREVVHAIPDENPAKAAIKDGSLSIIIHKGGEIGEIYRRS